MIVAWLLRNFIALKLQSEKSILFSGKYYWLDFCVATKKNVKQICGVEDATPTKSAGMYIWAS